MIEMGKNCIPEIAGALGLEISEEFDIVTIDGKVLACGPYRFLDGGLVDYCGDVVSAYTFIDLVSGNLSVQKKPWAPKDGDKYYFVGRYGSIIPAIFSNSSPYSIALLQTGNLFKTKEEAEKNADRIAQEVEEFLKEKGIEQ